MGVKSRNTPSTSSLVLRLSTPTREPPPSTTRASTRPKLMVSGSTCSSAGGPMSQPPSADLFIGSSWIAKARQDPPLNKGELPTPAGWPALRARARAAIPMTATAMVSSTSNTVTSLLRVSPTAGDGSPKIDGGLIATFSNRGSASWDGNGLLLILSPGWDFFDNDTISPTMASYFAASNHGSGRAERPPTGTTAKAGFGVWPVLPAAADPHLGTRSSPRRATHFCAWVFLMLTQTTGPA